MTRCPYVWFHFLIFQTQVFCTVATFLLLCLFEVCCGVLYRNLYFQDTALIQNCCIMSYTFNCAGVKGNIKSKKKKIRNWIENKWSQAMIRKSNPLFSTKLLETPVQSPLLVSTVLFYLVFYPHHLPFYTFQRRENRVPEEKFLLFTSTYL